MPLPLSFAGTIEYAICTERLTEEGDIWEPEDADPTLEFESATPFHLSPYEGKYGCVAGLLALLLCAAAVLAQAWLGGVL